ncbi:MAG TPA: DUF2267 domain-containing protein [Candidatus Saccharimonadia bacterium]|nr:DUF2267 domain-containing protein [Candidatus Saccharimonadia bacterium]
MIYRDLIRRIKDAAGASYDSAQDALELVVEKVAVHLSDQTRREFAAGLPKELQSAARMVPTVHHLDEDIVEQLMDLEDIDETGARARIKAAWQAVCDMFDHREVDEITAELPHQIVAALE